VIAFAGDALICVFMDLDELPTSPAHSSSGSGNNRPKDRKEINCCYRALQCANVLKDHRTDQLSAHIGVSFGEMKMALLGGLNEQWVYLMNGECVSELAACIESAGSQEIAATRECYAQAILFEPPEEEIDEDTANTPAYKSLTAGMKKNVNRKIDLTVLDDRSMHSHEDDDKPLIRMHPVADPRIVLIDYIDPRVFHREPSTFFRRMESNLNAKVKSSRHLQFTKMGEERDKQKVIENAALFVPRPILSAIYSEALDHIGELRHVTTAFVSLDSYDPKKNSDPCTLQPFFLLAQRVLQEAGGFLRQFLVDDKGCVFIAMWGMPSFTYSNNASRALYCAVAISMGVAALGHKVSIGITTGNVFCGTVGAPERRDYAGIGTDVNMAARLMGKAHGRVLLDVKTYHNLNEKTRKLLTTAEEMKLKGSDIPVTPYQYSADHVPTIEGAEDHHDHAILRRPVKTLLGIQIDKISNSKTAAGTDASRKRHSFFTLVIGPPGTGKSTAVEYFRHSARKRNIPCFFIKARPGHEGVPYGLMRELFMELVGEHNFIGEEQQRSVLMTLIDQAYANRSVDERKKAMFSLEIVMGVDWGKSNRKVGSFTTVVTDAMNSSKKIRALVDGATGSKPFASLQDITEDVPQEDVIMPLPSDKHAAAQEARVASPFENLLIDSSMTHFRPLGDMAFYNVLNVLLKNRRVAIIIEDAHFCDELSWTELALILNGRELEVSVLLTMRSNTIKAAQGPNTASNTHSFAIPSNPHSYGSFSQAPDSPYSNGTVVTGMNSQVMNGGNSRPGHRNSVLVNAISNSVSVSRSISISQDGGAPVTGSPKTGLVPISPHPTGTLRTSSNDANEGASRYGLKNQSSAALLAILGHERATVIEMTGLAEGEVREVLLHTLEVSHVSQNLVKLVFDVSSGNAYWCKAIANFIKERGVGELEDAIQKGDSPHQALKVLILMRMEKLDVDHQLVLKNAAIIGDEFSERMLQHVLPARIQAAIPESLDLLAEHGFIFCVEEFPETIFAFQNELIRETLYELMPPK
jgi:class 3 adenylate cyclase